MSWQKSKARMREKMKKSRFFGRVYSLLAFGKLAVTGRRPEGWERRFIVDERRKLVYLSICKAACSSIKAAMTEGETRADDPIHAMQAQQGRERFGRLPEAEREYYKFTFVRNPYARLVSCYEDKYHETPRRHPEAEPLFFGYLGGYLSKDRGFEAFVRRVVRIRSDWMEPHFARQYDMVYDEAGVCQVDYVGRYEELESGFAPIRDRYGLKPLPHYNATGKSDAEKWMGYYTAETAELVHEKYAADFAAFGYEESFRRLKEYLSAR